MRESIRRLVGIISETLPVYEPIYEFGSMQVKSQEDFADLRPFFSGKVYVGCDMREGLGVDKVLDLHDIDLPDNTAGTVLCFDTLEHVEYPHKAVSELHRITKPGGMTIISSVMDFPIHEHPYDYWRFTPEAFKSILAPFDNAFVDIAGKQMFPHTVIGVGFKGPSLLNDEFLARYQQWKAQWYYVDGLNWLQMMRLLTPPIVHGFRPKKMLREMLARCTK